ncbi:MAG: hypothetical protein NTX03_07305 [Bacteroidetes bacterium]|nr:hypothetical protein [Bacteroidota bacterium]
MNGFEGNHHLASGDDEFLMHKVSEKYPKQVMFLKNKNVMTHTLPAGDIGRFLAQRKRWVSKSKHYENSGITRDLTIAWVYNFMIVLSFVLGFFDVKYFLVFALGLSIKVMAEIPFFASISNFLELKNWRRIYPAATLVHSIYVVFIGIYGNFGGYRWKGRTVK